MTASGPEVGNWSTDGGVVLLGVGVDVSGICDLALCGGVDAVYLGGCEGLESWEVERLAESIDSGMLQELVTRLVDFGSGWISLEIAGSSNLAWEVVAGVEELEETSNGVEIFVNEVNSALLVRLLAA